MKRLSASCVLVLGAFAAGAVAASDPVPLPQLLAGAAATAAEAAESAGREAEQRKNADAPPYRGDPPPGAATGSRLLRSLSEQAARPASAPPLTAVADPADPGGSVAGGPLSGLLHGCPRVLLSELLAGATETDDAVSALAIERETLALCRERQEVVTGIVMLEGELRALLAELRGDTAGSWNAEAGVASPPIVKEPAPIRVVRRMPLPEDVAGASSQAAAPKHGPPPSAPAPDYSWFSIIGMAGALQAGVSDGELVWFVREGDRLPGGVHITGIGTKPPGVSVGGAWEASLPYLPRSRDTRLPARGSAGVDWSAALGGSAAGGGR